MKVLIFGATGMVGQGVLLECLRDTEVEFVVTLGRTATGVRDPRLREIVHRDLLNYSGMEKSLAGFDACFFCLGVASDRNERGRIRARDLRVHHGCRRSLGPREPGMTFTYISGSERIVQSVGASCGRGEGAYGECAIAAALERLCVSAGIYRADGRHSIEDTDVQDVLQCAGTAVAGAAPGVSESNPVDARNRTGNACGGASWI